MKKRLCIGLQKLNRSWQIVLDQLGLWHEEINYDKPLQENYSVIILNWKPNADQKNNLISFVHEGGAILEISGIHAFFKSSGTVRKKVKGLVNSSEHEAFQHISYIDLYDSAEFHHASDILDGLVHFNNIQNGHAGFLGIDAGKVIQHTGYIRKRFYSEIGASPDEIVSKVSKKQVSDLLNATLKELHLRQDIPYVQKWTSPKEKPVFGFRIDSDFGNKESIDDLYRILNKHQIPGTWFLHVQAHEEWLNHFQTFRNQEIALHGYKHGTSESIPKTQENIRYGKYVLEQVSFDLNGFCAPYGIWNKALYRSLKAFDFEYSSEFTFVHDGLPLQPYDEDIPLQLPIHPICTGSMRRKKYSEQQMLGYFKQTLARKLGRFEPVFFYHHPLQPGLTVIDSLFDEIKQEQLTKLTFTEFAEFWQNRQNFNFEAYFDEQKLLLNSDSQTDVYLQVSNSHKYFYLMKNHTGETSISDKQKFEYSNCYLPSPEEAAFLNRKDLRMIKTSLFDWKNRIRL